MVDINEHTTRYSPDKLFISYKIFSLGFLTILLTKMPKIPLDMLMSPLHTGYTLFQKTWDIL